MLWLAQIKFWILLTLSIPSAICSILILIYFFRQRKNIVIDHHLTLVLIIGSFVQLLTNFPFVMIYHYYNVVIPSTNAFCLWWNWWEYAWNGVLLFAMAWGSVERHLLIFQRANLITRRQRLLFHHLPMSIACLYPVVLYFVIIVLNPCTNQWDYSQVFCGIPCYLIDHPALATYDFVADILLPVMVVATANVTLIFRVVWQKRQHQRAWRRQRKMTRQLLGIALLYVLFWFPLTFSGLVLTFIPSKTLLYIQVQYFFFLLHIIPSLLPIALPNYLSDFKKTIFGKPERTIVPLAQ